MKCGSFFSLSRLLVLDQLDVNYGLNFGFCEEIHVCWVISEKTLKLLKKNIENNLLLLLSYLPSH